jgi:hypothetical protein
MGDERMRVMRFRSLLVAVLVFGIWSCYTAPVAYVPVRETRFRSETTKTKRIQLPLTAESRGRLLTFFRAGGDNDRIGGEVVDPEAEKRYAPLLDLLGDPRNLALEDLTEKDTYRSWFQSPAIRQVIDAREESPPVIAPVAVTDGKYWWVFYHRHKRLAELLVIKAIPREMKR